MIFGVALLAVFSLTSVAYVAVGKRVVGSRHIAVTQNIQKTAEAVVETEPSSSATESVSDESKENPIATRQLSTSIAVSEEQSVVSSVVSESGYPVHKNISVTFFWAGEEAGADNHDISNLPSAWDEEWVRHFGGVDDPRKRTADYFPAKFMPKENPFYFALPYNDFDGNGKRKKEVASLVPWVKTVSAATKGETSILKNQWIRIMKGEKAAYAQWEDVGPFKEDDAAYVFGAAQPASKTNKRAGLDVSPAVHDVLGLSDVDTVDWQFVDEKDVPSGPWKKVVTTSQVYWK